MAIRTVKKGECLSSIAAESGFTWSYLWNLPENEGLRQQREPNILHPGDRIFIPERRLQEQSGETERRHHFRRRGTYVVLRLVLMEGTRVRDGERCVLMNGTWEQEGWTDPSGRVEFRVPADVKEARLRVGAAPEEFPLRLGDLDPVQEVSGVQGRLNNLGFPCGPVDGVLGSMTQAALRAFQAHVGIDPSGEVDTQTRERLVAEHGC
jgi:N-acetylmuramoyl-L-alanine amidase